MKKAHLSSSRKKRTLPPTLKLWAQAREEVGQGAKAGTMSLCPKKGTANYKKIKARFEKLKKEAAK